MMVFEPDQEYGDAFVSETFNCAFVISDTRAQIMLKMFKLFGKGTVKARLMKEALR